ncbi:prepilin-type N-terminal cleavage/methylation domain-containing protein [Coprobacillus sp. AF33-1AC]|uniref:prepilin-type N-terminal cleavage/methylation domain-containing protein n=1 Tax=Coprobacillus sp. AF33-1AC TaxID=2292032 RepID=UPI000E4D6145|nr:prepilin-type N-terminal cleavage/methylation domain-containing protein [Coprobacillus sp. AF33-1AC]RHM59463.1 prepilin-type N-terminal cleavage/methylation domain-containing protein [Coprobacillus sp. AF33-1AC]
MKKINNKGMTLVEIVIVLVIASLTMVITGGILVNSLGYFDTSTKTSLDKQATDGIMDYISDEITYATEVRVSNTKPDDRSWHVIHVKEDKLYRDSKQVFNDDYYVNKRKLKIVVRGFKQNGYRLDMTVSFQKGEDKDVYKTSKTYELVNFNISTGSSATNFFQNISDKTTLNDSTHKLYYIVDDTVMDDNNDDNKDTTGDGTVADIVKNIDSTNYQGVYKQNQLYDRYDIVWYNGSWWQYISEWANGTVKPGDEGGACWKKLDRNFDIGSTYEYGDIVIYNNYYYKMISDKIYSTGHTPDYTSYKQWECLGRIDNKDVVDEVKKNTYTKYPSKTMKTNIVKNYMSDAKYNSTLQDSKKDDYDEYSSDKYYKKGSFIKMKSLNDEDFYELWYACIEKPGVPGVISSGWIRVENNYDQRSTYLQNDIVYSIAKQAALKANVNIFQTSGSLDNDIYNMHYWDAVY